MPSNLNKKRKIYLKIALRITRERFSFLYFHLAALRDNNPVRLCRKV